MRRIPNFVLLRAFEAAARLQSFAQAAQELALTPSAISHQVRELENYFGRPLFIRRNRRIEATAEGRRLHASLTRVMDALEASCGEVSLAPSAEILAVHSAPSLAVKWLGPRLPEFMRLHPGITIRLSSGADPMDLMNVREVDVAISYGWARERAGIEIHPLGVERIVPLCSPAMAPADAHASADDLAAHIRTVTLIDSQLSQVTWRDWFTRNGIEFPDRPRPSFDRAALAISAAADGMGMTLESIRLAERELARGDLVEFGAGRFKPIERETHFYSQRANQGNVEKIRVFREWLFQHLGL